MKWLLAGALFGLLLAYPTLLALVIAVVVAVLSKPVAVAFGLGLAVRAHLPYLRRRTR
ncbi:hypothetical protein ABZ341_17015 [Streptomyces sp. NPDC006173]|uniref:hypothetical protein n=1 Tax=Streptomyces sp. NPDC006173 TaxID=3155349 RepID=UPI0034101FC7